MILKTKTIPDAWYQAIYTLVEKDDDNKFFKNGILYTIEQGSYTGSRRLEFPYIIIEIEFPLSRPLLPDYPPAIQLPPVADMEYVENYFTEYLMNPQKSDKEEYTYASRINQSNQLEILIDRLNRYTASNQLILQIAAPEDILLEDPPCLRSIAFKVYDNKLNFHIYFRSNHLFNGFPVNMASLALLMEYILSRCPSLSPGKFVYFGSGLHLYEHDFELVRIRLCRPDLFF